MFEDDDYNRRVRDAGWEIRCARDAFVHHWQKASFRLLGEEQYLALFEENRKKYEEKWGEAWKAEGVDVWKRRRPRLLSGPARGGARARRRKHVAS